MNSPILLELVDERGVTLGTAEKLAAHQPPGQLHRAFSVFLFDDAGRMLLQRRAAAKYHWPGVVSNACCGHPYPDEDPRAAATRRVSEELRLDVDLAPAGTVTYHFTDAETGLVEHEYNHLFVGAAPELAPPNPAEVDELILVTPAELARLRTTEPFSGWFDTVRAAAQPAFPAAWT